MATEAIGHRLSIFCQKSGCPVRAWDVSVWAVAIFVEFTIGVMLRTQMPVNIDLQYVKMISAACYVDIGKKQELHFVTYMSTVHDRTERTYRTHRALVVRFGIWNNVDGHTSNISLSR